MLKHLKETKIHSAKESHEKEKKVSVKKYFLCHVFLTQNLECKGKKGPGSPGTFKKSPGTFGLL